MLLKRVNSLLLVLAFWTSPLARASESKAASEPADGSKLSDALVLAVHLTRPEVIDTCLKEIKASKYEFVWTSIDTKENRDPINVTFKLKALLIDKRKQTAVDKVAIMTVGRDVEKLRAGSLVFNCRIDYEAPRPGAESKH